MLVIFSVVCSEDKVAAATYMGSSDVIERRHRRADER